MVNKCDMQVFARISLFAPLYVLWVEERLSSRVTSHVHDFDFKESCYEEVTESISSLGKLVSFCNWGEIHKTFLSFLKKINRINQDFHATMFVKKPFKVIRLNQNCSFK